MQLGEIQREQYFASGLFRQVKYASGTLKLYPQLSLALLQSSGVVCANLET